MRGQRTPDRSVKYFIFRGLRRFTSLENWLSNFKKRYSLIHHIYWHILISLNSSTHILSNCVYSKLKSSTVISFINYSSIFLKSKFIINLCVYFTFYFHVLIQNKLSVWNTGAFFVLFFMICLNFTSCYSSTTEIQNVHCAAFECLLKALRPVLQPIFSKGIKAHRLCTNLFPLILKTQ